MSADSPSLTGLIAAELVEPVVPAATAMADHLAARGGGTVAAVLFYGSVLRTGDLDGILDFYVLVDRLTDWHARPAHAFLNGRLPPNVEYWELPWQGRIVRAKVAIMSRAQFARAVRPDSLDTTIWARFCQPARLIYAREAAMWDWAAEAVAQAVTTAAGWAVRLGPAEGTARDYWDALFRHTYAAELRVEKGERAGHIVDSFPGRYERLLRPSLTKGGVDIVELEDGRIRPGIDPTERDRARRAWGRRRMAGKPLNIARLVKAAFTFTGGVDYLAWKVERHSGVRVELSPWQRRHPILASPVVLWRLWRKGAIR
ncbi:hypothetical protein [Indioceanicola profundi]|uniref:hypothetical protein n=1 Tax=Indioceanicola profundi TaxID=2220096 RepID=UPI000E6AA1D4|nr:hypothetical protein [Indioceanicola profundi]